MQYRFQNKIYIPQIILVIYIVIVVIYTDKTHTHLWEVLKEQLSNINVIPPDTGYILYDHTIDSTVVNIVHHLPKSGAVEIQTTFPIVLIYLDTNKIITHVDMLLTNLNLIFDRFTGGITVSTGYTGIDTCSVCICSGHERKIRNIV